MTEAEFQQQVIDAAHLFGWRHLHVRKSIGKGKRWTTTTNVVGWPDLLLWKPGRPFVALELKVPPNKPTAEQLDVLASLRAAGAVALVVDPDDIDMLVNLFRRRAEVEAVAL